MSSVLPSKRQLKEGESLTTSFKGFKKGTTLYYKIVGSNVNKSDFSSGNILGTIKVGRNGTAKLTHKLKADKLTEGDESFRVQVFSDKGMKKLVGQTDSIDALDTSAKTVKPQGRSKTDAITGLSWDIGNATIESDRTYGRADSDLLQGFARSGLAKGVSSQNWKFEAELGKDFIVLSQTSSENGTTFTNRAVFGGSFSYNKGKLTSAKISEWAEHNFSSENGITTSWASIRKMSPLQTVANIKDFNAWRQSISKSNEVYYANTGYSRPEGDISTIYSYGNGNLFPKGWESNPFLPNLI